jgi:GntR family transcriptional regulator
MAPECSTGRGGWQQVVLTNLPAIVMMRLGMAAPAQRTTKQSHTRNQVFELIEQLGVGAAIPSERQLAADLGVSRLTVRAALDQLAREGYLVRRHGAGTFVREPKIAQELTLTSFSEDMRQRGMRPATKTLSLETLLAGAYLGRRLRVSPSERVVVVKRLRMADDETMAVETLYVPESVVPGASRRDFDGSFYDLLTNRYGIVIDGGVQTIEPTVTDEEESTVLGVPLHSPAFQFERTTRASDGRVVEFVRSIYRGDRYRLVSELRRDRAAPAPTLLRRERDE